MFAILAAIDISALRSSVSYRIVFPEDGDFDAVRSIYYGGPDRRPDAVVRTVQLKSEHTRS